MQVFDRNPELPHGFVDVTDYVPDAVIAIAYYSSNNFIGQRVDGYRANTAILTHEAALALKSASDSLRDLGYLIKVYDAYRPQTAVDHFVRWAKDIEDVKMKQEYYPDVDKKELFSSGYIAGRSSHSRGSTVDLTLIDVGTMEELDMGSRFDFFGDVSNWNTDKITKIQQTNRMILKTAMLANGFKAYEMEWWHYTLIDESNINEYFDFDVK